MPAPISWPTATTSRRRYLDDFDAWAPTYVNPFADLRGADADRNWNSARRLAELEADGVVAEVLFPNTVPPFFPAGNLVARPPTADELDLRWAGLRAHNRWMADFCAEAPGRRAGMVQIFLNDVDAAVEEIRWGREHGLFGGVLLPGVPPDVGLPPLIAPVYEPIWTVCEDLGMPLNNHTGLAAPDFGDYAASTASLDDRARAGSRTGCSGTSCSAACSAVIRGCGWCSPNSRRDGCPRCSHPRPPLRPLPHSRRGGSALRRCVGGGDAHGTE